ncbi:peptide chain release factor 1 [Pseudomonas phage COT4]|uniref:Peptide chain release factor n=1 Tax=Pseudomonas phage M5.1 TaxID=2873460 RepID=A0AAE9BNH8_9CAUD|nr:peptide chain release factor [Pseudomonas phage M5.1]UAV89606.1 peptide chain release factor [Pseudomonas phage M5.1]UGL61206.1 peptide chain release factor 1 [Pseudomonas phage COT4]
MIQPHDIRVTSYLPQSGYGAGGMTVGLTTSGMIVHHIPTGIGISCDSERSQWANKEKALQLLTSLLLAMESEKHLDAQQAEFQRIASIPNKVQMIKTVRERAGCGLKEAKEAVDRMGTIEGALLHLTGSTGYCSEGGACVCGGDLPAIREGCYNWQK